MFMENRPILRTSMFALACLVSPLSVADAADAVIIQNLDADDSVVAVHVRPSGLSGWGPNRIAIKIQPEEHTEIDLNIFGDTFCVFDMLIEDDDEDLTEYTELDLCLNPIISYQ